MRTTHLTEGHDSEMQTSSFANGDELPALGLGTWKSEPGEVGSAVRAAIRLGYRHIDCAAIYGNEREIGQALADCFAAGEAAREEMWITSKLWNDSHEPEYVRPALEKTLADLQLDYLDLYLMHWPIAQKHGVDVPSRADEFLSLEDVPLSRTWEAMESAADAGLCRHLGASNFSTKKLGALLADARRKPEMSQVELHPYLQQRALLEFCRENGVHVTAYSPLGSRDRPPRLQTENEPVLLDEPVIASVAGRHGVTPAQVLIAWALHRGTAVIPKSIRPARLEENFAAAGVSLSERDMTEIAELDRNRRYVNGTFWAIEGGPYTVANLWDE